MREFVSNEFYSQLASLLALFLDSEDLQSKYKDKPEHLKALREHAIWIRKFITNPDVGMKYKSCFEAVETRGEKRRMKHSTEESMQAPKKQKGAKSQASACTPEQNAVQQGSNAGGAESQASACTPKQTAVLQGSNPESAAPTSQTVRERLCTLCKTVQVKAPITRCLPCNTVYNRITNQKKRMDPWCQDTWDNMDKDRKVAFIRSCRNTYNHELKGLLRQFLYEEMQLKTDGLNADLKGSMRQLAGLKAVVQDT